MRCRLQLAQADAAKLSREIGQLQASLRECEGEAAAVTARHLAHKHEVNVFRSFNVEAIASTSTNSTNIFAPFDVEAIASTAGDISQTGEPPCPFFACCD